MYTPELIYLYPGTDDLAAFSSKQVQVFLDNFLDDGVVLTVPCLEAMDQVGNSLNSGNS